MKKVKSPYLKQTIQFITLSFCLMALARLDNYFIVEMPDPRAFNIFLKVFAFLVVLAAVVIVYRIDERKLRRHELFPQDFIEADEREEQLTARAARRSFVIMDFVLLTGSIMAMLVATVLRQPELKWMGAAFFFLYVLMHTVFLLTMRRQAG